MKNKEFAKKIRDIATNYKTVYANGMFGQPITESIISQKTRQLPNWYTAERQKNLRALIGKGYFGFDCCGLLKGGLWGWNGNLNSTNGGATYQSNGVPDIDTEGLLSACKEVSTDFSNIEVGEYLWLKGHCGIYIGDGLAIECTPKWQNKVQITACNCNKSGYNRRDWTKHGKLPYIEYVKEVEEVKQDKSITVTLPQLQKGSKCSEVKTLQRLLKSMSYNIGDCGVDGDFGKDTKYAVEDFQSEKELEVDGIVGKDTWGCLLKG